VIREEVSGSPVPAPSHLDLLTAARAIRRAAAEGDTEQVHTELTRLRNGLLAHVHAERHFVGSLPPPSARLVGDGQRRLLELVDAVILGADDGRDGGCACLVRAVEVDAALRRQARLERTVSGGGGVPR
jgi:hypothetical protein